MNQWDVVVLRLDDVEIDDVKIHKIQNTSEEEAPEVPEANILQPDRKFEKDSEFAVAGIFTMSSEPPTSSLFVFPQKRGKRGGVGGIQNPGAAGDVPQQPPPATNRKPYSYNDRKRKNADERRDIKKKLFMDLGIIRSSSGIDGRSPTRSGDMGRDLYHWKAEKTLISNIYSVFALEAWYSRKTRSKFGHLTSHYLPDEGKTSAAWCGG
ncbi:hypothetical protein CRE_26608 [Caenorhabditis remanei]|uniref:Uncharacterized protein n=1 Tax=Caenorhabditis remanei TaxID=31234 RepID=E3MKU2_CAERE|nr:hypothetical protein CRE_26608 [Caenorhabditis remanei]